jgi:hypothetical protein
LVCGSGVGEGCVALGVSGITSFEDEAEDTGEESDAHEDTKTNNSSPTNPDRQRFDFNPEGRKKLLHIATPY